MQYYYLLLEHYCSNWHCRRLQHRSSEDYSGVAQNNLTLAFGSGFGMLNFVRSNGWPLHRRQRDSVSTDWRWQQKRWILVAVGIGLRAPQLRASRRTRTPCSRLHLASCLADLGDFGQLRQRVGQLWMLRMPRRSLQALRDFLLGLRQRTYWHSDSNFDYYGSSYEYSFANCFRLIFVIIVVKTMPPNACLILQRLPSQTQPPSAVNHGVGPV